MQDFQRVLLHAVREDVGQAPMQQFARAFLASRVTAIRESPQRTDSLAQFDHSGPRQLWLVGEKVIVNLLQIVRSGGRPAGLALGLKHPRDAGFHFLFFDQFSTVGLLNAFAHFGAKTGIPLQQAQGCVFHQLLSVGACVAGNL